PAGEPQYSCAREADAAGQPVSAATMRFTGLASLALVSGAACAQSSTQDPSGPFTAGVEALIWWYKSSPTPVPVIVSDAVVGHPETKVLLGGGDVDTNPNPGFRVLAGYAVNA